MAVEFPLIVPLLLRFRFWYNAPTFEPMRPLPWIVLWLLSTRAWPSPPICPLPELTGPVIVSVPPPDSVVSPRNCSPPFSAIWPALVMVGPLTLKIVPVATVTPLPATGPIVSVPVLSLPSVLTVWPLLTVAALPLLGTPLVQLALSLQFASLVGPT